MFVEQLSGSIVLWGSENPHDVTKHEHDSLKVSVCCALMKNKVISLFFC